jgi:hypothetical protein
MPYPETTDAFAVTDIKNWSTFKRQEVSVDTSIATINRTDSILASPQEVRGV